MAASCFITEFLFAELKCLKNGYFEYNGHIEYNGDNQECHSHVFSFICNVLSLLLQLFLLSKLRVFVLLVFPSPYLCIHCNTAMHHQAATRYQKPESSMAQVSGVGTLQWRWEY